MLPSAWRDLVYNYWYSNHFYSFDKTINAVKFIRKDIYFRVDLIKFIHILDNGFDYESSGWKLL